MMPRKKKMGRRLPAWGVATVILLSGCYTTTTTTQTAGACPQPVSQFDIARQSSNGACVATTTGAAAGAACDSAADCASNCCTDTSVQLCVDHKCQAAPAACACAAKAPSMSASGGTCGGESASVGARPRGGAPSGAPCHSSGDCAEQACGCPGGSTGYFAAACLGGVCDGAQACACVAQQFQNAYGKDVCGSLTPPPPTAASSCSGESAGGSSKPRGGAAPGAACTDSSQCAEASCPCGSATGYYAAACIRGACDVTQACACVAQQYQAQFGKDVCAAAPPSQMSCDGQAGSSGGPRSGVPTGGACTSSTQCAEAQCSCGNGKSYFAASCVNGRCDNTSACACVQQQYQTTFGKDVCA